MYSLLYCSYSLDGVLKSLLSKTPPISYSFPSMVKWIPFFSTCSTLTSGIEFTSLLKRLAARKQYPNRGLCSHFKSTSGYREEYYLSIFAACQTSRYSAMTSS